MSFAQTIGVDEDSHYDAVIDSIDSIDMATITIRNFDDHLKTRLRIKAAEHGHSMEEEARRILGDALNEPAHDGLGTRIRERFAKLGGIDLELPDRGEEARAATVKVDGTSGRSFSTPTLSAS